MKNELYMLAVAALMTCASVFCIDSMDVDTDESGDIIIVDDSSDSDDDNSVDVVIDDEMPDMD